MSDLSEIAAKLDAMTLDELLIESRRNSGPVAGGECDSKHGWMTRLGMGSHRQFDALLDMLIDHGLAEWVDGFVDQANGRRRCRLVKSATLEKKAG